MYDIQLVIDQIEASKITDDSLKGDDDVFFTVLGELNGNTIAAKRIPADGQEEYQISDRDKPDTARIDNRITNIELQNVTVGNNDQAWILVNINEADGRLVPIIWASIKTGAAIGGLVVASLASGGTAAVASGIIGASIGTVESLFPLYKAIKDNGDEALGAFMFLVKVTDGVPEFGWSQGRETIKGLENYNSVEFFATGADSSYRVKVTARLVNTEISSVSAQLQGTNKNNIILTGDNSINGVGNELDNIITGNESSNILNGLEGDDTIYGRGGDDIIIGGVGKDNMVGSLGNDVYYVDNIDDKTTEQQNQGIDIVNTSVSFTLSSNIENLILLDETAALNGTGNEGSNEIRGNNADNILNGKSNSDRLFGNAGNDTLIGEDGDDLIDGGIGDDLMLGGIGDDIYYVDSSGDILTESPNQGSDLANSSVSYTLGENLENLFLTGDNAVDGRGNSLINIITGNSVKNILSGEAGDDSLFGQGGDDFLDGGAGADYLVGGLGNDTYYIDNLNDTVLELIQEGIDTVNSSITYTLDLNLENLNLIGTESIDGSGNQQNNVLIGNVSSNILNGDIGEDTIYGNNGNDTLFGGEGNDVLIGGLDSDILNGGSGTDTASYSTALSSVIANLSNPQTNTDEAQGDTYISIENLIGSQFSDILTGDTQANYLWGLDGKDNLDGLQGADTMVGGLGNDTYNLENIGDITIEGFNEGIDTVNAFINCTLASNLDNLFLIEGSTAIVGSGNDLDNLIFGNTSNNTLDGGSGNDTLYGGLGIDTMVGGLGNDRFVFNSIREKGDTILDFAIGNDQLVLTEMMRDIGYRGSNPIGEGIISARQVNAGLTTLMVDPDGLASDVYRPAPFIFLNNVSAFSLLSNSNSFSL
jgi:Ca2+-binding RTX toxin-like protein